MTTEIVDNTVVLLNGTEVFTLKDEKAGFNVLDFWRFQFSNLSDIQGRVGEFLVAMALKKETPDNNNGWTLWDINYREKRIEVKTTAYYQPWRYSKVYIKQRWEKDTKLEDNQEHNYSEQRTFGITKSRDPKDNEFKRMNDIYVFVLNKGKNKEDADPLKLENWEFYIIPTFIIDKECRNNKTISLGKVKKLIKQVPSFSDGLSYDKIKDAVDNAVNIINVKFTNFKGSGSPK